MCHNPEDITWKHIVSCSVNNNSQLSSSVKMNWPDTALHETNCILLSHPTDKVTYITITLYILMWHGNCKKIVLKLSILVGALLFHFQEVSCTKLCLETSYSYRVLLYIVQYLHANFRAAPQIRSLLLPPTVFIAHCSLLL
jgi:hypothetical protein